MRYVVMVSVQITRPGEMHRTPHRWCDTHSAYGRTEYMHLVILKGN